jgi:hypothetical protein
MGQNGDFSARTHRLLEFRPRSSSFFPFQEVIGLFGLTDVLLCTHRIQHNALQTQYQSHRDPGFVLTADTFTSSSFSYVYVALQ